MTNNIWQCNCCHKTFDWKDRVIEDGRNVSPCCKKSISMIHMDNQEDEKYVNWLGQKISFFCNPKKSYSY